MASGNTPHLDALFIRAAHKAAIYILELAMGTTMESFEPYAMLHTRLLTKIASAAAHGTLTARCLKALTRCSPSKDVQLLQLRMHSAATYSILDMESIMVLTGAGA